MATIIVLCYFEVPLNNWFANCEMDLLRGTEKTKTTFYPIKFIHNGHFKVHAYAASIFVSSQSNLLGSSRCCYAILVAALPPQCQITVCTHLFIVYFSSPWCVWLYCSHRRTTNDTFTGSPLCKRQKPNSERSVTVFRFLNPYFETMPNLIKTTKLWHIYIIIAIVMMLIEVFDGHRI